MSVAQTNSVRNLEHLYTTVVALALSLAIYNLIDVTRGSLPFRLELVPFFFTFLITLIPFYHGALRHLDITYVEQGGRHVRKGALLVDFSALFIEGCLFVVLSALLTRPLFFVWGLVALLAFDTIWGVTAYLAFSKEGKPKAELTWALINFVSVVVISIYLIVLGFVPSNEVEYVGSLKLSAGMFGFSLSRTVVDYILCWDTYYPSVKH